MIKTTFTRSELRQAQRYALKQAREIDPGESEDSEWMDAAQGALDAFFLALKAIEENRKKEAKNGR